MASDRSDIQKRNKDDEDEREFIPPDGGWGWAVVFSSFMIHVIADGIIYTFGIFYTEFLKYFQESKGATAWVSSIMVGTTFCIGPIASGLTNKYGCRRVTIAGSLLATTGLLLSLMAPNITFLYFTIGICTGAGFGLMYLPSIVCVTWYFEKKRAFATGIAVCGSGIGTFALAPIVELLIDSYGWKGAMLIVAGIVLNCCIFGAIFRPLSDVRGKKSKQQRNGDLRENSIPNGLVANGTTKYQSDGSTIMPAGSMSEVMHNPLLKYLASEELTRDRRRMSDSMAQNGWQSHSNNILKRHSSGPIYRKDIFYNGSLRNIPECHSNPNFHHSSVMSVHKQDIKEFSSVMGVQKQDTKELATSKFSKMFGCSEEITDAFREMTDFKLMGNIVFLLFGFSNFFTNVGFNVPYLYSKDRALEMKIANNEEASFLLSVIGISNTIGRVVLGYLSDKTWVNRLWLYNSCLTVCGIATALSSFCTDYQSTAAYSAIFGVTTGAYVSLTSVILVDLLGLEKLTNAFGLLLVFEGIACLIGPPITGWLFDWTGSYDPGYFVSGTMIALSGLMLFAIPCFKRLQSRRSEEPNNVVVYTL